MRLLVLLLFSFPAVAAEVLLDNEYVHVTRNGTSCTPAAAKACGDRVIVAMDRLALEVNGVETQLSRGDIAVFRAREIFAPPAGDYFEVAIKPGHPPAPAPAVRIAPEKNAFIHDAHDYFVFEEKLEPGETRARHSHSQRVVIQLNRTRLQQWPDGEPDKFVDVVPDKPAFSPPVVHVVKNVGVAPLRGIIIEFKPE